MGLALALLFSLLYVVLGTPSGHETWSAAWLEGLYFSFTTFATLGYGDVSYGPEHPLLRMLSTVEAWCGAVFISLFVVLLARKVFR